MPLGVDTLLAENERLQSVNRALVDTVARLQADLRREAVTVARLQAQRPGRVPFVDRVVWP